MIKLITERPARERALSAIASQLEVEIKSNITDMQEAYGVGLNATVNEYNRVVTESRINTNLRNIEYIDEYEKKVVTTYLRG